MRNHPDLRPLIPITALRHLYKLLRSFSKGEFHLAVAKEFNRLPQKVAKLVTESREHFALYDNRGETFHIPFYECVYCRSEHFGQEGGAPCEHCFNVAEFDQLGLRNLDGRSKK